MQNEENPIQSWAENDSRLSLILNEIHQLNLPIEEQAELAFHRLSEIYNLPKLPEEAEKLEEATGMETISVYQELGLVKFLEPDEDIRGLVLIAVYNVLNEITVGLERVYKKAGMNEEKGICYRGENAKVTITFLEENVSWFDSDCKLYLKYSD